MGFYKGNGLPPATEYSSGDEYLDLTTGKTYLNEGGSWKLISSKSSGVAFASLNSNGQVIERLSYEGVAGGVATLDANRLLKEFPQISTIADLRNATSIESSVIYVRGYYSDGDGGEGLFYKDTSDTTSADNGGTIIVDSDGNRWKRVYSGSINVRWFGARGNAIELTDVSISALSTTLTSASASFSQSDVGKTIVVDGAGDSGGYRVPLVTTIAAVTDANTITLAAAAQYTISGGRAVYGYDDAPAIMSAIDSISGEHAVYIPRGRYLIASTRTGSVGRAAIYVDGKSGIHIYGDGKSTILDSSGITVPNVRFTSCSFCSIRDLYLYGMKYADRAASYAQYNHAIYIDSSQNIDVSHVYISRFNGGGVKISGSNYIKVSSSEMIDVENTEAGVYYGVVHIASGSKYVHVVNNIIQHTTSLASGVSMYGVSNCVISENTINLNQKGSMGIYVLNGSSGNRITNNYISGSTAEGVVLIAGDTNEVADNIIASNIIEDFALRGVSLQRPSNTVGQVSRNIVSNNVVRITSGYTGTTPSYGIVIDSCNANKVINNEVYNVTTRGIAIIQPSDTTYDNEIVGNLVSGSNGTPGTAISVNGERHVVTNNRVSQSVTGISFSYFHFGKISNNYVEGATTAYKLGIAGTANSTHFEYNLARNSTTAFSGIFSDTGLIRQKNRIVGNIYHGTATLINGVASVTNVNGLPASAGKIVVYHISNSGTPGALYITNVLSNSFDIYSTSSTDNSTVAWEIVD